MTDGFTEIVHKILQRSDVHTDAIPSLDLYIDQIITLLDQELDDNKRNAKDKILTKTMVNNYSKQGILKPIKGKKYSKDHIVQMLIIYSLKNTLSIEEIKRILQPIYKLSDENKVDLCYIYDHYLELKEDKKDAMSSAIDTILKDENLNLALDEDRLIMVLCLCALSEFSKSVAQALIDHYYSIK